MKTFITIITFIGLVLAEPAKPLSYQQRSTGAKEVIASVQVRIIIPDRNKTIQNHNSIAVDSLKENVSTSLNTQEVDDETEKEQLDF